MTARAKIAAKLRQLADEIEQDMPADAPERLRHFARQVEEQQHMREEGI